MKPSWGDIAKGQKGRKGPKEQFKSPFSPLRPFRLSTVLKPPATIWPSMEISSMESAARDIVRRLRAAGHVAYYAGGRGDLERRLIRAIGDPARRFAEDRLRMLRAVRFATVLGFEIDAATWDAVVASAPSIVQISAERIREELVKIFLSPNRARGWDLLDASGLMRAILPELEAMKGCEQPPQFHPEGDVFKHTRIMLEMLPA